MVLTAQKLQYGSPKCLYLAVHLRSRLTGYFQFFLGYSCIADVRLHIECVQRFSVHIQYAEKIEIKIGFGAFCRIFVSQR